MSDSAMTGAVNDGAGRLGRTLELRRSEPSKEQLAGLKKVAEGFDAVFTQTLLGELMAPAFGNGLGGSGPGASVVQGMIEQNLADHLGKSGGFGIGRMLEKTMRPFLAAKPVEVDRAEAGRQFHPLEKKDDAATKFHPLRAAVHTLRPAVHTLTPKGEPK